MGYYTDGSTSLTVSDSYGSNTTTVAGTFKLTGTALTYSLTSTNSGAQRMNSRVILCVDHLNTSGTAVTSRYDSGYQSDSSTFPSGHNTSTSGSFSVGNYAHTLTIRLYVACMQNRDENQSETTGGSTSITRSYVETTYTVTFNANGGSVSTTSKTVTYDSTYGTLPTPSRNYYTFDGWFTSSTGGTQVTSSTKVSITSNQTLYAHWSKNHLTVNYYSNYANKYRLKGSSPVDLDSSKQVLVHSQDYDYNSIYDDTLRNYSGHSDLNSLIMRRHGYLPTRYWNTQPNASGIRFFEGEGTGDGWTGQEIAEAFGLDLSSGSKSVNVYPEWELQTEVIFSKDGYVYAANYGVESNIRIGNNKIVYAPNFTVGSNIAVSSSGMTAKGFRYGHPKYKYASTELGDYK